MADLNGWIKLHRSLFDNPIVTQSPARLTVWLYLLTHATSKPYKAYFGGNEITLQPGQLITSRKSIANCANSGISDSLVERALKAFENAHQIEQQTCNKNRLITLLNWDKYQLSEQQNEQQTNNKRTASEQQANTNGEYKEDKKIYKEKIIKEKVGVFQNVLLTKDEIAKLKEQFTDYQERIDRLSEYVASSGKSYKSHYATILSWARKDKKTVKSKLGTVYSTEGASFDVSKFEDCGMFD